jgi:hypothetical protein
VFPVLCRLHTLMILPSALVPVRSRKSTNGGFEAIDGENALVYTTAATSGHANHHFHVSITILFRLVVKGDLTSLSHGRQEPTVIPSR